MFHLLGTLHCGECVLTVNSSLIALITKKNSGFITLENKILYWDGTRNVE